ncbi:MAG: hypothetical protein OXQ29_04745 [Rhodospirillaceae bacterium]|nr:hypothetical protein [Rhodospirillaceae bacterium]
MQSLVADINAAVVAYRAAYKAAREEQDSALMELYIHDMNALLSLDFCLTFDSSKYAEQRESRFDIECGACNQRQKVSGIKYAHASGLARTTRTYPYVVCRQKAADGAVCGARIPYDPDRLIRIIRRNPDTTFVPEAPRISNVFERCYHMHRFLAWADQVWPMLERQWQLYREAIQREEAPS